VDTAKGYIYYSFTTQFVKSDLEGHILGSVNGLIGHLGCLTFNSADGKVYGSLEYKNDAIGRGILSMLGREPGSLVNGFYAAIFDVDRIDRMDMDAEKDGIMTAVYLRDVVADYEAAWETEDGPGEHRYGCSGIDGMAIGPVFGAAVDSPKKIMITYGVYGDLEREDNDYQVVLQYDPSVIDTYGRPLNQAEPHHNGPAAGEARYFAYTGNTVYGVQNLEYDAASRLWLTAVYAGRKEQYPNYSMYFIDGSAAPKAEVLKGRGGETGLVLTLADPAGVGGDTPGCRFAYGATGMYADGCGHYYFSNPLRNKEEKTFSSTVMKYKMDKTSPDVFVPCKD